MKESPEMQRLEDTLRRSNITAGGFLGDDRRPLTEIIDYDMAQLSHAGYSPEQVGDRMRQITEKAVTGLGNWIEISEKLQARTTEAKGRIPCPWPHPARFDKRVTEVYNKVYDKHIKWSDLSIHLIAEHGFFEGKNAFFRIEPLELISIIF